MYNTHSESGALCVKFHQPSASHGMWGVTVPTWHAETQIVYTG